MTSLTEAGQTNQPQNKDDLIDAINQIFALFRVNFHNQYYKAFPEDEILSQVKKLWFESLQTYQVDVILKAAKSLIETSEYLPTLHRMRESCNRLADDSIPDAHSAYIEACRAPSPKAGYDWSHPIVYHAGKASDWYFLASTNESIAFPIFKENYQKLAEKMRGGESLELPKQLEQKIKKDKEQLDKESAKEKIKALKETF